MMTSATDDDGSIADISFKRESPVKSNKSMYADKAVSMCSLTSSVMGPQTYRPPDVDHFPSVKPEEFEDVDLRIKEIKYKIESEMKESKANPMPTMIPHPFVPPPMPSMEVDEDSNAEAPTPAKKSTLRNDVVLDPTSGRVVDIAALPWHQRFALTHPYFRNMPYVPPHLPFVPGAAPRGPPFFHPSNCAGRGGRPYRVAPLVRYIPGGSKDVNRQSAVSQVDFSSELMSYVRMRKEMLKMDLREKIRQRKEELLKSQKAVFDGGPRGYSYKEDIGPSGKYHHPPREELYRERGREDADRGRDRTTPSSQPNKTPRQMWQAKVREAQRQRSRSSSSSSSSSSSDEDDRDSRRKWIAQRKATMMAKTALIKEKIDRDKAIVKENQFSYARRRSPSPQSARDRALKFKTSPFRNPGRREVAY